MLEGRFDEARRAWATGSLVADQLPTYGAYEADRLDFRKLLTVLEATEVTAP